jgi:hypothetical protein
VTRKSTADPTSQPFLLPSWTSSLPWNPSFTTFLKHADEADMQYVKELEIKYGRFNLLQYNSALPSGKAFLFALRPLPSLKSIKGGREIACKA